MSLKTRYHLGSACLSGLPMTPPPSPVLAPAMPAHVQLPQVFADIVCSGLDSLPQPLLLVVQFRRLAVSVALPGTTPFLPPGLPPGATSLTRTAPWALLCW